ncbi:MAG: aldo/keto reductase [Terriglobia bacterium]
MMFITGYATEQGTARYRSRFASRLPGHFRQAHGLWLSSLGLGTYLGEADSDYDTRYQDAAARAIDRGINVIDSAVNYRHQRSERSVGQAIALLIKQGRLSRDELFVSTKGGFLTFDGSPPDDPSSYFYDQVIRSGLAREQDVAADCHVMTPEYLAHQVDVSRRNLGLETIDLYYLHNPETQLSRRDRPAFYRTLKDAFVALEEAVAAGKIRFYGTASWNAYRVAPESAEAVDLNQVLAAAEMAGGLGHHFRAVQLPFNLAMPEALVTPTQSMDAQLVPFLRRVSGQGLMVFASASLLQGQLTSGIPQDLARRFPLLATDAQRALQFVRSTPGITSALVGMSSLEHVDQNVATANTPPLNSDQYRALFGGGSSV